MSIKKKIVWLPYDMDTAIGINNEGELVFGYELEDIDHQTGGANVFNGQDSVIWKNIRAAFPDELKAMYRSLRSSGALSYQIVEQMFENHQGTWSEAIYNEDSRFKYIDPFVLNNINYLGMLLGSKAEQRKWWLYNRFRYLDSKYIAGDAMTDTITLRPYAAANVSITPYADIYATIAWDAKITQERCPRNASVTLECPYQSMNDNVVTIYSASQLASIGDVSGLQVGLVDISRATRLQSLKIGDPSSGYDNINLRSLTLGNNVLLQTLDARNCSGLGDTTIQGHTQTTVDISGCSIIENVYFEGTKIQGITLPNGGVLKKLHLPATITNLTVRNQSGITDFSMPSYQNISTLRIENCGSAIPVLDILDDISASSRVRILGFELTVTSTDDVEDFFDYLDTMRGLDENGNNLENAVVSGDIFGLDTVTGAWMAAMNARGYTDVNIHYNHVSSVLTLMSYDNTTVLRTIACIDGTPSESIPAVPTKPDSSDGHYSYTGIGWNTQPDKDTADPNATTNVVADRTIYPAYTATVKTYTVTWKNEGTVIETDTGVAWGTLPHYDGSTPTYDGQTSTGWDRDLTLPITGNTTINATYKPKYTAIFVRGSADGGGILYSASFVEGTTPVYGGSTPTSTQGSAEDYPFEGWSPALAPIYANTTYTAQFGSPVVDEEITDDWDTIIASIDAGTYKTKYKLGNYKPLDLGTEGIINMQIVAMDTDELASGGYAPLTFIGKELLNTSRKRSSSSSKSDWAAGTLRRELNENILPLLPLNVSSRIQATKKFSMYAGWTNDKLFIPSSREVFGTVDTLGVGQYIVFIQSGSRLKHKYNDSSTNSEWWLRSKANGNNYYVNSAGGNDYTSQGYNTERGVCLGFCLGLEPETTV